MRQTSPEVGAFHRMPAFFIFVATIVEVLWDGLTEAQRESFLRKMGVK